MIKLLPIGTLPLATLNSGCEGNCASIHSARLFSQPFMWVISPVHPRSPPEYVPPFGATFHRAKLRSWGVGRLGSFPDSTLRGEAYLSTVAFRFSIDKTDLRRENQRSIHLCMTSGLEL